MSRRCRLGLSLVELLVAISILAVLLGMLLPAVQSVRESSRQTVCTNNLRQQGLAVIGYESTHSRLPPGTLGYSEALHWEDFRLNPEPPYWKLVQHTSFLALILPFIEQANTSKQLSGNMSSVDQLLLDDVDWFAEVEGYDDLVSTSIPAYSCPSDFGTDNGQPNSVEIIGGSQPVLADGIFSDALSYVEFLNSEHPGQYVGTNYLACSGAVSGGIHPDPVRHVYRGLMSSREKIRSGISTDGTSNTVLIGETLGRIVEFERTAMQCWLIGGLARGRGNVAWEDSFDNRGRILGNARNAFEFGFASKHPGTIAFCFGDGSVTKVNSNIENQVFLKLCGAFDGELATLD